MLKKVNLKNLNVIPTNLTNLFIKISLETIRPSTSIGRLAIMEPSKLLEILFFILVFLAAKDVFLD